MHDITIVLKTAKYKNNKYKFKDDYKMKLIQQDNIYIFEDPKYSITCTGKTLSELLEDFYETIDFLYNNYYIEDNNKLNKKAIELKNNLKELIIKE